MHDLSTLSPGWRIAADDHLEKEWTFPDFAQALAFTNRIGAAAESMNHHPDIQLGWGRVHVSTWTHSENALTAKDFELAHKIDELSA